MKATFRKYKAESDFLRVRDLLQETFYAYGSLVNWGFERWNWARYHPCVFEEKDPKKTEDHIRFWENAVGVWENAVGEIVGVAHTELPYPNEEVFFERHPGYEFLLDEMIEYAEATLVNSRGRRLRMAPYEYDRWWQAAAERHGYRKDPNSQSHTSELSVTEIPPKNLPEGFDVRSMADGGDLALRCKVQGLGFNHPDPAEWTTPAEYREVQQAPYYREDFDLFVAGPDGEYVSCCIIWFDNLNKVGVFEPVCTHPDFRRRGFGREVMMEGIRRVMALGATKFYVGSNQQFYQSLGFELKYGDYTWVKEF